MTLKNRLDQIQQQMASTLPAEILTVFGEGLAQLQQSGIEQKALQIGDTIPEITLPDINGQEVKIDALLQKGPVIISFIRGSWCPFCMTELSYYQSIINSPETAPQDVMVLFITPQTSGYSAQMMDDSNNRVRVLVDADNKIAQMFGLAFTLDEKSRAIYAEIGADLALLNGNDTYTLPIAATYGVDTQKIIRAAYIDVNYMNRAEADTVLSRLK